MGKIINFANSCQRCKYHINNSGICTNKKYKQNLMQYVEKGRCPHFEEKTNE